MLVLSLCLLSSSPALQILTGASGTGKGDAILGTPKQLTLASGVTTVEEDAARGPLPRCLLTRHGRLVGLHRHGNHKDKPCDEDYLDNNEPHMYCTAMFVVATYSLQQPLWVRRAFGPCSKYVRTCSDLQP